MKDAQDRITINGFYNRVCPLTNYEWECLKTLCFGEEDNRERIGLDGYINGLTSLPLLEKFYYQPTANIAGFRAGTTGPGAKTILPAKACMSMDFRMVPDQMPEEIFQCIRAHLDRRGFSDIELVPRSAEPPYRAGLQSLFDRTVIRCVKPVYGIDPEVFAGAADTTALYQFCHGTGLDAVLFSVGNDHANIHAPNENLILEDYLNAIKLAATVMEEFALAKPEV